MFYYSNDYSSKDTSLRGLAFGLFLTAETDIFPSVISHNRNRRCLQPSFVVYSEMLYQ